MKRVITAAVLIPLVFLVIFKGTFLLVVIVTAIFAELAAWEYLSLADSIGAKTPRIMVLLAIAVLFAATFRSADLAISALGICSIAVFVVCTFRSPLERVLLDAASSVFALIWIALSLTTIPLLWAQEHGASLLLFLFCVVWSGDIAGLYVGRSLGCHKLAPHISPKKTWEGSVASMAGSLLATAILFYLARQLEDRSILAITYGGTLTRWLLLAVLLNIAAQLGDLVESAVKRGSGVKDSGTILPGHGGILDRIDALLLAAPVLWYAQIAQQYF
ncbi:MAG TPA: phosphatidate cytidylyltransferase [Acidobacteriaceae bacterium]|jgi:phosphatidate cytidylyltransferase